MDKLKFIIAKVMKKILHMPAIKNSNIHGTSKVCSGSHIVESSINRYSYIGNECSVIHSEIGSFSSIADNCYIGGASHPIEWISTSPVFHEGKNIMRTNFSEHEFNPYKKTVIGNDVWIGSNCLIKSGIKIGDGSIVGMGSVVTKDVPPYTIIAGNPAIIIRKRFEDEVIKELLDIKWWNWNEDIIRKNAKLFQNPKVLISKYDKNIK